MKILVKFSEDIGIEPLEKEVNANETVENLEVLISLNYQKMSESKLVFQGKPLPKGLILRDVFNPHTINEVILQVCAQQVNSLVQLYQQYPVYSVGAIVAALLFVLFIMGE